MKQLIINTSNYRGHDRGNIFEPVSRVSETVPNEGLTVKEIVDRYIKTGGAPVGKVKNPQYHDGDFDSPDLEKVKELDHFDLQQFREGLAEESLAIEAELIRQKEISDKQALADSEALAEFKKERAKLKKKSEGVKKDDATKNEEDE